MPYGRICIRPFQWQLRLQWSQSKEKSSKLIPLARPSVPPGHPRVDQQGQFTVGSRDHRCGLLPVLGDSSTQGWGVHLQELTASGFWSQDQSQLHINVLELQAIWLGLRAFSQGVENVRVALMSDNTSAVAFPEKSGGHQIARNERFSHRHMSVFREEGNVTSSPLSSCASECVSGPSVQEGSNPQDRVEPKPDRSRQVFRAWGRPFVDLFALGKNTKLAIYVTPIWEETSWKVDSLVQNWNGLYAYAYPPTSLIRACLSKVRTERRDRPDSSRLAQPGVLSGPFRSRDRLSNNSPTSAETAQADLLTPPSSASVESQPSLYRGYQGIPQGKRIF